MKAAASLHVVTGGLGYSGRAIVRRLLMRGARVRTLTNSPGRPNPFGGALDVHPMPFGNPRALARSLEGASVLYNTYWVRFNWSNFDHTTAVGNTRRLFEAARLARVRRIVHVSITNPSEDSPLEYFRGKAVLERELGQLGVPFSILRPAVLFGDEDILINNIAWALRRLPVFGVFGDGSYRLRPIHVGDLACLAVEHGGREADTVVDAVGPESFAYRDLVREIGRAIGRPRPVVSVPPGIGHAACVLLGRIVGDVIVTREEIAGLMAGLLDVDTPASGSTLLTQWAAENASIIGKSYASELGRRRSRRDGP